MTGDKHTVSAFDDELEGLRAMILELGARASAAIGEAVAALEARDAERARAVARADRDIDRLAARAESAAVSVIALRAPMADDLRAVVAAIKMSALLERTADYAKNIARRVESITEKYPKKLSGMVHEMTTEARGMLEDVVEAYAEGDVELAHKVCERDDTVDDLHDALTQGLIEFMIEEPKRIGQAAHLLFVSKHLERIGDQATNMAEMIAYTVTGKQTKPGKADLIAA